MITRSRALAALMLALTVGCTGAPVASTTPTGAPTVSPTTPPTEAPTASPSPTVTLPPTPSPTPEAELLIFDDGALTIEVPFGAVPAGVELNAIQRGPEEAPPELAEIEFRGTFYSLEPDGLTFAPPLRVTRRVAVADLGFDVEQLGMPIVNLALRDSEANWQWLPNQAQIIDDEFLYVSADLTHTSTLVGFGGNHFARPEYTPPELQIPVGSSWELDVILNGPITAPAPPQWYDAEPFTHTGVLAHDPVVFHSPEWVNLEPLDRVQEMPAISQQFDCLQPGTFYTIVGYEYTQAPGNLFYSHLGLDPPGGVARFDANVECLIAGASPSVALPPDVTGACIITVHTPRGTFVSYLRGLIAFGQEIRAVDVTISGANDDEPVSGALTEEDVYEFLSGLRGSGKKTLQQVLVTMPDGTQHDVRNLVAAYIGGAAFEVPFPGEPTFGQCP